MSSADAGPSALSPTSPRASADMPRFSGSGDELERVRAEKDHLSHQYRSLLGKLTAMRNTLGEKLKEDAEELDRREAQIHTLTDEAAGLHATIATLRAELEGASAESAALSAQLAHLRSQSDSSSSDVLSLTREMRELRGEMERLRAEREEWEGEAGRERERREALEDEVRGAERRERAARDDAERAVREAERERERADNLQDVLGEFQNAKDAELRQATAELEAQLKRATVQLSEYKLRCANAESSVSTLSSDAGRVAQLEKEARDKAAVIAKLRHDAVVTNEHLTEALRRLRKNQSDNNVDRRLVTNILLSFLTTARADSKRFEMLSLLSTILSWDDEEREKAGLQRAPKGKRRQSAAPTAEEDAMSESFSNLFVEFLLKEASQGRDSEASPSPKPRSPGAFSPGPSSLTLSPTPSGATTPLSRGYSYQRTRALSSTSNTSRDGSSAS
ncbi:hypothetical protein CC85DRAFT_325323 [Cutaneotrichosporon oleaginosum]|uniref:GRIP domain-containing protein n=1 Tax=Cutaneotrichosporon oleaginosum TaxID=879819 RepID=A0A0J0XWZ0_9TREE|nr:uncharacterized protein CC85DRAFT_325323 [Cutaneotrichosporon oleaginosum]KLT45585.1 hypothetical protein CC85DRAFT_325323 [Cutaneotrichosporon oleaginosum]TXT04618.1 hypothetical protein COLE_07437 [Cutaneotrichosporon oleaginosum]